MVSNNLQHRIVCQLDRVTLATERHTVTSFTCLHTEWLATCARLQPWQQRLLVILCLMRSLCTMIVDPAIIFNLYSGELSAKRSLACSNRFLATGLSVRFWKLVGQWVVRDWIHFFNEAKFWRMWYLNNASLLLWKYMRVFECNSHWSNAACNIWNVWSRYCVSRALRWTVTVVTRNVLSTMWNWFQNWVIGRTRIGRNAVI